MPASGCISPPIFGRVTHEKTYTYRDEALTVVALTRQPEVPEDGGLLEGGHRVLTAGRVGTLTHVP